jgi:hypothetical protein
MASIILASIDETNNDDAAPYEFFDGYLYR